MRKRMMAQLAALCMLLAVLLGGCTMGSAPQEPVGPAADVEMVHSLDISVLLQDNGDAVITEVWDMTVLQGTEYYLTLSGLDGGQVKDLQVYDETGKAYRVMGQWDVDENLEYKENRCGILGYDDGSYEVCWGLGSYGRHRYTVQYTLTGLVRQYSDYGGFHHTFVNDNSAMTIYETRLTIAKANGVFSQSDTRFWGLLFTGECGLQDGKIVAYTTQPLLSTDQFALLARFEQTLFSPHLRADASLADVVEMNLPQDIRGDGLGGPVTPAMGREQIHSVDIAMTLEANGTATVTEVWDVTVLQGTEWYLQLRDGDSSISVIEVSDETGCIYEKNSATGTRKGSLQEKEGLYNIERVEDGRELWWGIGSYGRHQFTVTYSYWGYVANYADCSGFIRTFVNDPTDIPIQHAKVTIEKKPDGYWGGNDVLMDVSNTWYWADGFDGTIAFVGNKLVAESSAPLGVDNGMRLALRFSEDVFTSWGDTVDMSFSSLLGVEAGAGIYGEERTQNTVTAGVGLADVHSMTADVLVQPDGALQITEVWDITAHTGSEWYTTIQNNYGVAITDVSVTDDTGSSYVFENDEQEEDGPEYTWLTQRTAEEKAGRCGLNLYFLSTYRYRLSWGLAGLGRHQYTVHYTVGGMGRTLQDKYALELRFLSARPTTPVENATVTVRVQGARLGAGNTQMWALGYDGVLSFVDGQVCVQTSLILPWNGEIWLYLGLDRALLSDTGEATNSSFSDETSYLASQTNRTLSTNQGAGGTITTQERIYTSTFSSSKYTRTIVLGIIAVFLTSFLPSFLFRLRKALHKRRVRLYYKQRGLNPKKASRRSYLSQVEYCRELPFQGSLSASAWALQLLNMRPSDSDILSAHVLRWMQDGRVQVVSSAPEGSLQAGADAGLFFPPELEARMAPMEKLERETYSILASAARADRILAPKELKEWGKTAANADRIVSWKNSAVHYGKAVADTQGMIAQLASPGVLRKTHADVLSDAGIAEAKKLLGLKRYLLDFTLIHERMPPEVILWQEYLVFASLLGIADEVESAFSRLYPQYFQATGGISNYHVAYHMARDISRDTSHTFDSTARRRNASTALRSSASSGGGSSGSGGGGSRGGGDRGGGSSSSGGGRSGGGRR